MKSNKKRTADALEIIHQEFFERNPEMGVELEKARADNAVARKIHDIRTQAGFTQRQLAKMVGTTASVICRLESAEYEGHSLAMLSRIAQALDRRVEIHFVPARNPVKQVAFA